MEEGDSVDELGLKNSINIRLNNARRQQYVDELNKVKQMRGVLGLQTEGTGMKSDDPTDPTVYSSKSGGRGLENLIMNNFMKVYKPEEIVELGKKNAIEEAIKKEAVRELIKEGKYKSFGNDV